MDIQRQIGADIVMAFDECPPGTSDYNYAQAFTRADSEVAGTVCRAF